ncbi:hypothetical protein ScPMuIL_004016 [Solemya velum]
MYVLPQIWCRLEYGYLATPIYAEFEIAIENFTQTLNRRQSQYWLGGSNALNVSDWWWFTNQFDGSGAMDHYGYTDWAQGYPQDEDNQNCLYIDLNADGPTAWRNDNCRLKKFPVCMVYSLTTANFNRYNFIFEHLYEKTIEMVHEGLSVLLFLLVITAASAHWTVMGHRHCARDIDCPGPQKCVLDNKTCAHSKSTPWCYCVSGCKIGKTVIRRGTRKLVDGKTCHCNSDDELTCVPYESVWRF